MAEQFFSPGIRGRGHDARLSGLNHLFLEGLSRQHRQLTADSHRAAGVEYGNHAQPSQILHGTIVYAYPYCNWYRVQMDGPGQVLPCVMASQTTHTPMGPRVTNGVGPYNRCTVIQPPGWLHGIIQSIHPPRQFDPNAARPDYHLQGSGIGAQREDIYTSPMKSLLARHGVKSFGSNRPLDGTSLDWGVICETGSGIHLDPFWAYMRISELCGIWLHYHDDYMRFAGWNLDLQTAAHLLSARLDEGENRLIESHYAYPWEALGLYSPGAGASAKFSAADVQFKINKGTTDLPDGSEDIQPIARYQEFGGYLGQGRQRLVMVPTKQSGIRHYGDDPTQAPDLGVFQEFIGLDGTYGLRSAKQLFFAKYCLIPVAKEIRLPEDQKTGDDARKDNYKFSGTFGSAAAHKVGDVAPGNGPEPALAGCSAILDLLAYAFNWQAVHPFHYHSQDYGVPQESDFPSSGPSQVQDFLNFGQLNGQMYMDDPTPKTVTVDSRYKDVKYFSRLSYMAHLPDGSVVHGDGYGAEIILSKGTVRIAAPGDIVMTPGRNFTVMAGCDINLRAHNSFDASAGTKDLRLKAEKNLQVLSHTGGVLIESQASGNNNNYKGKVGEDVTSSGVVFKAAQSNVCTYAGGIYLRTGGPDLQAGPIVLDADKGDTQVVLKGNVVAYCPETFDIAIGPDRSDSTVRAVHTFDQSGVLLDGQLLVNGPSFLLGDVLQNGVMENRDGYFAVDGPEQVLAVNDGPFTRAVSTIQDGVKTEITAAETAHNDLFTLGFYQPQALGDDILIQATAFSFRDDGDGVQYHAQNYVLYESRWQQMVRLGQASGGSTWDEPAVAYQGFQQLPYPGYFNWNINPTLQQLTALNMFDVTAGTAEDRPGPYETPKLSDVAPVSPAAGFTIISG